MLKCRGAEDPAVPAAGGRYGFAFPACLTALSKAKGRYVFAIPKELAAHFGKQTLYQVTAVPIGTLTPRRDA